VKQEVCLECFLLLSVHPLEHFVNLDVAVCKALDKPMDNGRGWANTAVERAVVHLDGHVEIFARLAGLKEIVEGCRIHIRGTNIKTTKVFEPL